MLEDGKLAEALAIASCIDGPPKPSQTGKGQPQAAFLVLDPQTGSWWNSRWFTATTDQSIAHRHVHRSGLMLWTVDTWKPNILNMPYQYVPMVSLEAKLASTCKLLYMVLFIQPPENHCLIILTCRSRNGGRRAALSIESIS